MKGVLYLVWSRKRLYRWRWVHAVRSRWQIKHHLAMAKIQRIQRLTCALMSWPSFKHKFGNCRFPSSRYIGNPGLGNWCKDLRTACSRHQQKGQKMATHLSVIALNGWREVIATAICSDYSTQPSLYAPHLLSGTNKIGSSKFGFCCFCGDSTGVASYHTFELR